jgi:hypothetical protein
MIQIKTFTKPSAIEFAAACDEVARPKLSDAKRGETFLRDGAVCMRVDVSAYQAMKNSNETIKDAVHDALKDSIFIINLQTGRVFIGNPIDDVTWIKVKMTLEGEA